MKFYILATIAFLSFSLLSFDLSAVPLEDELSLIYSKITAVVRGESDEFSSNDIYLEREKITQSLRESLLEKFKASRLFAFPDLDVDTFNSCVFFLNKMYQEDKGKNSDVLLHTWSYLSGIRVIGLKNGIECYYNNRHFLPENRRKPVPTLIFYTEKIDAMVDNRTETTTIVPSSLVSSAAFYRSNFGRSKLIHVRERQTFVNEFFKDEFRSLFSIEKPTKEEEEEEEEEEESQVNGVLDCVLRLKLPGNKVPCYSLGLVKLFQNTAIYLSSTKGPSRLITGPCSLSSISYLGLQDGIFMERGGNRSMISIAIDYLFGLQLFNRGLHRHCITDTLEKTEYYPNYCDVVEENPVLAKQSEGVLTDTQGMNKFGHRFYEYIRNPGFPLEEPYALIAGLIEAIDNYQLRIPLIQPEALEVKWFEPDYSVDLSGKMMFEKFSNRISDDNMIAAIKPDQGEVLLSVSDLIRHLRCFSYQGIEKINLSGNYICDNGAKAISEALSKNILPELTELDLSYNRIGNDGITGFEHLLYRDTFKYLIIYSNYVDSEQVRSFKPNLLRKVIWIPEAWLDGLISTGKITEAERLSHKNFYKFR